MNTQGFSCKCKEPVMNTSPGGALDASETAALRAGMAERTFRGAPCNMKFASYADRYRYLRGVAGCNPATVTFPCCSTTTLACASCGGDEE